MTPHSIWSNLIPQNARNITAFRASTYKKVLKLLKEWHPDIYLGRINAKLTPDESGKLVEEFQKNTPGHVFRYQVRYLIKGLNQGKKDLGWDVAIPPTPFVSARERPPFPPEISEIFHVTDRAEDNFLSAIKNPPPSDRVARIGQLLMSAILLGGMVEKRWLQPWITALLNFKSSKECLWLDMELSSHTKPKIGKESGRPPSRKPWTLRRRWCADPLTRGLIIKWSKDFPEDLVGPYAELKPEKALRAFCGSNQTGNLLEAVRVRIAERVTPFLVSFARGETKGVPVPPQTWARLLTRKALARIPTSASAEATSMDDVPLKTLPKATLATIENQEILYGQILKILLTKNRSTSGTQIKLELERFLKEHADRMFQTLAALVAWAIDLLTRYPTSHLIRGRAKSRIRPNTVRRYLGAIAFKLITVSDDSPLLKLDSDELHDLYRDALDLCHTLEAQSYAGKTLWRFHEFLTQRCGAPEVDFSDLLPDAGPPELGVNANLISIHEFDRLLKVVGSDISTASRVGKIRYLIAILGFRTGLRRGEIRKLRIIDLQGRAEPELLIRNNRYAYNKTGNSVRRIPLRALLSEEELTLLLRWREHRIDEEGQIRKDSLLFCQQGHPEELLDDKLFFDVIQEAMRQVTGDPTLRFHHLRHSSATWLIVRLLPEIVLDAIEHFDFLRHPFFSEEACQRLRKTLLGESVAARPILYAVVQLVGHAGPEVTLLHYFHLADFLLARELSLPENEPLLDGKTIMTVTGLTRNQIYYLPKANKNGAEATEKTGRHKSAPNFRVSDYLHKLQPPADPFVDLKLVDPDLTPVAEISEQAEDNSIPDRCIVAKILKDLHCGQRTIEELAKIHELDPADIAAWQQRAQKISSLRAPKGGYRHINVTSLRKNPDFHFPRPVGDGKENKIVERIFESVGSFGPEEIDRIRSGIDCFIRNFHVREGGVAFGHPTEARQYVDFLEIMGITEEEIRLKVKMPRSFPGTEEVFLERVSRKWLFSIDSIILASSPGSGDQNKAWVQVVGPGSGMRKNLKSSNGFRYAMYLLAIIFGVSDGIL